MTWRATVFTLFPAMFPGPLGHSLAGRALERGQWALEIRDKDWFHGEVHGRLRDALGTHGVALAVSDGPFVSLEAMLHEHPQVAKAAVIGLAHDRWGEAVTAVVVRTPDATVTEDELGDWARARLAGVDLGDERLMHLGVDQHLLEVGDLHQLLPLADRLALGHDRLLRAAAAADLLGDVVDDHAVLRGGEGALGDLGLDVALAGDLLVVDRARRLAGGPRVGRPGPAHP